MNILKRDFFSFAFWHQGKEHAAILIAPTVEVYLGIMQKHQELAFMEYFQIDKNKDIYIYIYIYIHIYLSLFLSIYLIGCNGSAYCWKAWKINVLEI